MTRQAEAADRTLSLLFTDVEDSTRLIDRHAEEATEALLRHHAIVDEAVSAEGGAIFERVGDAVYSVFDDPAAALRAALGIHTAMAEADWGPIGRLRVRIAIDTGPLNEREGRFFGRALFRCARIQALARGGETLVSDTTAELLAERMPPGHRLRDLGRQRLRGLSGAERVFSVVRAPGRGAASGREPIRVLLVDDYEVVRRGLRGFLELVPELSVVGEAATGSEAVDAAFRLEPDVVLMDLVMPDMDGPAAIAAIRERQPDVACIALTSFAEPARIGQAMEAGAVAHLLKDADGDAVVAAVKAAAGRPA